MTRTEQPPPQLPTTGPCGRPMHWTLLERRDDWGAVYFAPVGFGLQDGMASNKLRERFATGEWRWIRWPVDGVYERVEIVMHQWSYSYEDHGNRRAGTCDVPGFMVGVHGVQQWVCVDQVEHWLEKRDPLTVGADPAKLHQAALLRGEQAALENLHRRAIERIRGLERLRVSNDLVRTMAVAVAGIERVRSAIVDALTTQGSMTRRARRLWMEAFHYNNRARAAINGPYQDSHWYVASRAWVHAAIAAYKAGDTERALQACEYLHRTQARLYRHDPARCTVVWAVAADHLDHAGARDFAAWARGRYTRMCAHLGLGTEEKT